MEHRHTPELEDLYDEHDLARIERPTHAAVPSVRDAEDPAPTVAALPTYPRARWIGFTGALVAGAMQGIGAVFEARPNEDHIVEFAPDLPNPEEQAVTYHHVPGFPEASRIAVRPWLLATTDDGVR